MHRNCTTRYGALITLFSFTTVAGCLEGALPRGVEPQGEDRQQAFVTDSEGDFTTGFSEESGGEESTGGIDICDPNEEPDIEIDDTECGEAPKDCVPRNVYGKVAANEYFNTCRNYCFADDLCFDRAAAMLGTLNKQCGLDIRGADGKWCGPFTPPDSTGTCDDLAYKVIIRYAAGETWTYHIATMVKTCEDGMCMIDPIGQPGGSPTTTCQSPEDWCKAFAHGDTIEWHDTDDQPPAGKVYCEIAPGDQLFWKNGSVSDPTDPATNGQVCKDLEDHVAGLCARGKSPFPAGCGKDKDGDGIPDAYDKCPNSPPDVEVDYCDKDRLGCGPDEVPGGGLPIPEDDEDDIDTTTSTSGGEDGGGSGPIPVPEPQ